MSSRISRKRRLAHISLVLILLGAVVWFSAPYFVTLPSGLLDNPDASPVMVDRHGTPIARLTLPDFTRSSPVTAGQLPHDLVACTLAAEDKRFYQHGGIDFLATVRAARDLLSNRRIVSGASTITQQLIKISSPPGNRTPLAKIRETLAARRLERIWSKSQILTAYLNRLDYGNLRTGPAEAARFYFQKPLADLSLAESALLAGLPQAPSRLNPIRHPRRATARRNLVLSRLANLGKTDPGRISTALAEPLNLRPLIESSTAPWLATLTPPRIPPTHHSTSRLQPKNNNAHSQHLEYTIQTTLDLPIQRDIEAIVREETTKLRSANLRHAAVVVIHNPTGEILALVSSSDWNDPRGGQLNGTLTPRSPGSSLKPFTYLLAIERNHRSPSSILADIPSPFRTPQGLDLPENYDRAYRGPVTLRSALACSLNVTAMRELNELGGPAILHQFLTRLGLTTLTDDPATYGLGLTIGNAPVRLLELTNAYATLARGGLLLTPKLFPNSTISPALHLPFSETSTYLLADILSDPSARAPAFPPGGPLDLPFRCAIKTGTSSDFRDNWCLGFTPEFTVGVWAGNFENQPMKGISGIDGAGPIFHRSMLRIQRDRTPKWFTQPDDLIEITIDSRNGKTIPPDTDKPYARKDITPRDRTPSPATSSDYDPSGKAMLDPTFATWYHSKHNLRRNELAMNPASSLVEPLRIITPADQSTFLLDPEIPSGSHRLRPVTNLPGTARWSSPTLHIEISSPEPIIHLKPGRHTLTATDPREGFSHSITLNVISL